jgi:hypothetical protein
MTNIIKRLSKTMNKMVKRFTNIKKQKRVSKKSTTSKHRQGGGAVYSFDFNDKVGGLPANVALNGTADGDCPSGNLSDLGMTNYNGVKGGRRGGKREGKSEGKSVSKSNKKRSAGKSKEKKQNNLPYKRNSKGKHTHTKKNNKKQVKSSNNKKSNNKKSNNKH